MMISFIVLFHPRRRHHHRWRNIWGIYLVLLWVHRDLLVLFRLERHRCRVGLLGQGVLWDRLGRVRHRVLGRRFDRLVRVVHLRQLGQHRRAWLELRWLDYRLVLFLRLCQVHQVVRLVQVGQVGLLLHLCLGCQDFRLVRVRRARRVRQVGQLVLVGMVCTVVVELGDRFPMVDGQGIRVGQVVLVCRVFRSFLAFLVVQEDRASNSFRILRLASWPSFCYVGQLDRDQRF